MTAFYERLFAGDTIGDAVCAGRSRMAQRPGRPSPKGDLPLADWAVPVYYRRREVRFAHLRVEPGARVSLDERLDRLRDPTVLAVQGAPQDPLDAAEEFVGRDGLFHTLEGAARTGRVVVLHGPGGSGKTELAKAFARWWRDTGGVAQPEMVVWQSFEPGVASFGLDGVLATIGLSVLGTNFARHSPDRRRELVHKLLREQRLLLVWDNFESVASMPDPTAATPPLDDTGRSELKDFLHQVAAVGRSVILVTSRTPEDWLGELPRITVGGLAPEEAIEYADQLLRLIPAAEARRADRAFADLLRWLAGYPLSMRLTLPHLATIDPAALLAGLRGAGPVADDTGAGRTGSLSASIAYSFAHLDPADRGLLVAVGLCHGVASDGMLSALSRVDVAPARFRDVSIERWTAVLDRTAHVGLLTRLADGLYGIHPALPVYLAAQWSDQEHAQTERALLDAYAALGAMLVSDIESGDAPQAYRVIALHRRTMGSSARLCHRQPAVAGGRCPPGAAEQFLGTARTDRGGHRLGRSCRGGHGRAGRPATSTRPGRRPVVAAACRLAGGSVDPRPRPRRRRGQQPGRIGRRDNEPRIRTSTRRPGECLPSAGQHCRAPRSLGRRGTPVPRLPGHLDGTEQPGRHGTVVPRTGQCGSTQRTVGRGRKACTWSRSRSGGSWVASVAWRWPWTYSAIWRRREVTGTRRNAGLATR
jgi:hypothetical protein